MCRESLEGWEAVKCVNHYQRLFSNLIFVRSARLAPTSAPTRFFFGQLCCVFAGRRNIMPPPPFIQSNFRTRVEYEASLLLPEVERIAAEAEAARRHPPPAKSLVRTVAPASGLASKKARSRLSAAAPSKSMEERLRAMQNVYKSDNPETYSAGNAGSREKDEPSEMRQLLRSTEDEAPAEEKPDPKARRAQRIREGLLASEVGVLSLEDVSPADSSPAATDDPQLEELARSGQRLVWLVLSSHTEDRASRIAVRHEALAEFAPVFLATASDAASAAASAANLAAATPCAAPAADERASSGCAESAVATGGQEHELPPAAHAAGLHTATSEQHGQGAIGALHVSLRGAEPRAARAIAAWLEAASAARESQRQLEALREEQATAATPLEGLDSGQLARLFAYHALRKQQALLTYSGDGGDGGGGDGGAGGAPPPPAPPPEAGTAPPAAAAGAMPRGSAAAAAATGAKAAAAKAAAAKAAAAKAAAATAAAAAVLALVERQQPSGQLQVVDGRMLAADAVADTGPDGFDLEHFRGLYGFYRPELHDHVLTWCTRGVRLFELLDDHERAKRHADEAELAARARDAHAAAEGEREEALSTTLLVCAPPPGDTANGGGAAAPLAAAPTSAAEATTAPAPTLPAEEPLALACLRVAHRMGVSEVVRAAAAKLGSELTVTTCPRMLMIADALDCHPLRDRVSGWIVAHLRQVTAEPLWTKVVPTREQTRILALAAATRNNPFGLVDGEAATDAREMLAWSIETLEHMERCLETAKEELAADIALAESEGLVASAAAHAQRMIDDQEGRLRVVRAFVAQQEVNAAADAASRQAS